MALSEAGLDAARRLDRWSLAYAAVSGAVLLARLPRLEHPGLVLAAHLAFVALVLLAPALRKRGSLGAFLGCFYPLIAAAALYTEVGLLNRAGGRGFDLTVQGWEQAVFSSQPSRDWIRAWPSPALSTVLHAAYLSYYLILACAPLGPWLAGRRASAVRIAFLMMATFYVCYAAFLAFPVAGPRYSWAPADNAATATAAARLTHALLRRGSAWGTAFPSSHVAVSLVAALACLRALPALGRALLAAALLLALGTVYGQLHYALDVVAGAALAALVIALRRPLLGGADV